MPKQEFKHVSIPLDDIQPSPENTSLYRPILEDDPEVIALADSIRQHGVREPLVITEDYFILSGHRRYVAAKLAGLNEVPCRMANVRRMINMRMSGCYDVSDEFIKLLREYNRQRVKTREELLKEAAIDVDPETAYQNLSEYRQAESKKRLKGRIKIEGEKSAQRSAKPRRRCLLPSRKSFSTMKNTGRCRSVKPITCC